MRRTFMQSAPPPIPTMPKFFFFFFYVFKQIKSYELIQITNLQNSCFLNEKMKIVSIFIQPHAIVNLIWQIYIKKIIACHFF